MTSEYPPSYDHYAVAPTGDGIAMTHVGSEAHMRLPAILDAFAPVLGRPRYLRLAGYHRQDDRHVYLHVFDRADAPRATIDVPAELQEPLKAVLAELRGDRPVPELRPAWARSGWHDEAEHWVGAPLDQVRAWPLSAVLRAGDTYMKAAFPLFRAEPVLTDALARATPGLVPEVLAIEPERGWLTMRELPGVPAYELPAERWDVVLHTMGRVQAAWVGRTDELLAIGAQDRRLHDVEGHEALRAAADQLAATAFPDTVGHGDFHPGNVHVADDGSAVIFDWSDACVCHPLLDLALFVQEVKDDTVRRRLASAWADGFGAPTADVLAALPVADVVTCIHQHASYRAIAAAVEPDDRYVFDGEPQRWLEAALAKAARPG